MLRVSSLGLNPRPPARRVFRCFLFPGARNIAAKILAASSSNTIIHHSPISLNFAHKLDGEPRRDSLFGSLEIQEKTSYTTETTERCAQPLCLTKAKGDREHGSVARRFGDVGVVAPQSEGPITSNSPLSSSSCSPSINQSALRTPLHPPITVDNLDGDIQRDSFSEDLRIQESPSYPAGRPWRSNPIPRLRITKPNVGQVPHSLGPMHSQEEVALSSEESNTSTISSESHQLEQTRSESVDIPPSNFSGDPPNHKALRCSLLHTLGVTSSATEAWNTYTTLLTIPPPDGWPSEKPWTKIPLSHLHRLCRVLSRNRPKTRTQFLRLLSVLHTIQHSGGQVHLHEWNAVIDNAGKGWRKTRPEDFKLALGIFYDMVEQRPPGSTFSGNESAAGEKGPAVGEPVSPDIVTYTTLLSIAARTLHGPTVRHASSLLQSSGIPPNRITHLSLLKYFTFTKSLSGVRSTLLKMKQQGMELGLDGINACIWAYGHNNRPDVVMMIYRLLRHNVTPDIHIGEDDVDSTARRLKDDEGIIVSKDIKPNEITFTIVIQTMAYHGDLAATLSVFMDMLSSENLEMGARLHRDKNNKLQPSAYSPTLPIFRAIFLGFSRHGVPPPKNGNHKLSSRLQSINRSPTAWSLENLSSLFSTFLALPEHIKLSQSTISWIMVAFDKTSGHDMDILRKIWTQLEVRFGGPWGGSRNRLYRLRASLFHPGSKYQPPDADRN